MNNKIHVLFLITGLSTGGAEIMLLKLLQHIDRRFFSPRVISLTSLGDIGPEIQRLGIEVDCMNMPPGRPDARAFVRLITTIRQLRPDIIHTWMYHADLLGGLAGRLTGVRRIIWGIRHTDLSAGANKRTTLAVAKVCALFSHWLPHVITVNSDVARVAHVDFGYAPAKMRVIPNGFDLARFAPDSNARVAIRDELNLDSDTPLVGMIGRFHPQKNQLGFVEAMRKINKHRPDVRFLLAGSGVDGRNTCLVEAIAKAELDNVAYLLGRREDMPTLMAALDVLALPSVGEAFPNVVGEAMSCGVPCAVANVGDSAHIVGDTGRVAGAGDMNGLARDILMLLSMDANSRVGLGSRARARVSEMFEIGAVVRRHQALYEEMRLLVKSSG